MKYIDSELYIETAEEKNKFASAAAFAGGAQTALNRLQEPFTPGKALSAQIIQGLAKMSMCEPGSDYHGLSPEYANGIIAEILSDEDVEEYFGPYLLAESARLD